MIHARDPIQALRQKIFEAIRVALLQESGHKSYEGALELTTCYPNYFEASEGRTDISYHLQLHCYVLGPSRHYEWFGDTVAHVCEKATADVDQWINELQEEETHEY